MTVTTLYSQVRAIYKKGVLNPLEPLNSCRNRDIPMLATFDRDFDQVTWLQNIAEPSDLA